MKRLNAVLKDARKYGVQCTERTFWKYHRMGLLPEGQKLSGHGNVVFFPDETVMRLRLIQLLTKEMEFTLQDVAKYPWSQLDPISNVWFGEVISEDVLEAKNSYQKAKDELFREFVQCLLGAKKAKHSAPAIWPKMGEDRASNRYKTPGEK